MRYQNENRIYWDKAHIQEYVDEIRGYLDAIEKEINSSHIANYYIAEKAKSIEDYASILKDNMEG